MAGTSFDEQMTSQTTEILLSPVEDGCEMTLISINELRGSARVAGFTMKRSQRELLEQAFDSLELALTASGETSLNVAET